jgi:hypothetical protein
VIAREGLDGLDCVFTGVEEQQDRALAVGLR